MNINWMNELIWVVRIAAATLCGACIGYERENNLKTAGIRTHSIVALTSCLMMLVSKYGFADVLSANVNLDPSRIAAGIVTAIGFLGAGVIFTRKLTVSGLTTSAGLWATVGIGVAMGGGMYIIAVFATLLVLGLQFFFHRSARLVRNASVEKLTLRIRQDADVQAILSDCIELSRVRVQSFSAVKLPDGLLEIKVLLVLPEVCEIRKVLTTLKRAEEVVSVEVTAEG